MTLLTLLANEVGPKTLWDPTIVGILAVVAGVFLFCGSTYLLLATNVGARLGFLVAFAALTGMMVVLSSLWLTTNTPLNSPKGREGKWNAQEVLSDLSESQFAAVRDQAGDAPLLPAEEAATIKPFVDAALVTATVPANQEPPEQPFAKYTSASYFLTEDPATAGGEPAWGTRTVGGGAKNVFWHKPWYAVVEFCDVAVRPDDKYLALGTVPTPECKPGAPRQYVVLLRDYGSIRLPPAMYVMGSLLLFALGLLGLHWFEKDLRARRAGALVPANA